MAEYLAGGMVYASCYDGFIHAIDAKTGTEKWNLGTGETFATPLVIANGIYYFMNADGHMFAIR